MYLITDQVVSGADLEILIAGNGSDLGLELVCKNGPRVEFQINLSALKTVEKSSTFFLAGNYEDQCSIRRSGAACPFKLRGYVLHQTLGIFSIYFIFCFIAIIFL